MDTVALISAIASMGTLLMSIVSFWILRVKIEVAQHKTNIIKDELVHEVREVRKEIKNGH